MILKTGVTLLLVIGLALNNFASNDPTSTTVTSLKERTAGPMQINVPSNMETFVSLFDQEGDMIYSDIVDYDENAGKMYDFSGVENGVYTFKTVTEHKVVETTFEVETNVLRVLSEEISYRPIFGIDGNFLTISYMNLKQDDIYISLEYASNLYYEKIEESDMSYERVFYIKYLSKGEYSITLKSGENTYNYFFKK